MQAVKDLPAATRTAGDKTIVLPFTVAGLLPQQFADHAVDDSLLYPSIQSFNAYTNKKEIMKRFLLFAVLAGSGIFAGAQAPTTVTTVNNCNVFRNFNNSDEGFSSPSIYSDGSDLSFFWDAAAGAELETSGVNGTRSASLISPIFFQSAPGVVTVGFKYVMPNNTQYRIRVISTSTSGPLEVIATTANGPLFTALPSTSGNICVMLTDADLTVGRQIRFEFTFRATNNGNMLFDDLALSVSGGPLPVTFEGFVARKNADETIKLLWNVGQEVNVKGYYIESSTNGTSFINAAYVDATGKKVYSYDYNTKFSQSMFFRIRNIDFDGKSKYSPVIRVNNANPLNSDLLVYPIPARDLVTVQHGQASAKALITLVSTASTIMQQVTALPFSLQTQLNISQLPVGIYLIKYDDGKGNVQSAKLVKN